MKPITTPLRKSSISLPPVPTLAWPLRALPLPGKSDLPLPGRVSSGDSSGSRPSEAHSLLRVEALKERFQFILGGLICWGTETKPCLRRRRTCLRGRCRRGGPDTSTERAARLRLGLGRALVPRLTNEHGQSALHVCWGLIARSAYTEHHLDTLLVALFHHVEQRVEGVGLDAADNRLTGL